MRILRGIAVIAATLMALPVLSTSGGAQTAVAKPTKGDRELGEYLSSQCTGCHQVTGRSAGGVPPIVAWPEDMFVAVIESYKKGERENETMRTISHRLSLEEIEALAAYFGSLPNQPDIK